MNKNNIDELNISELYKNHLNKAEINNKTKIIMQLYNKASDTDKELILYKITKHASTLEEVIKLVFTGMKNLYDDKCDIEDDYNRLKSM